MKLKIITTLFMLISIAGIAQKKARKKSPVMVSGASFHFILDYKGGHKEFFSTQYQNHDGMLLSGDGPQSKLTIYSAADNDKNDDRFKVSGAINAAEKKAFSFDDHSAGLNIMISGYPDVSAFVLTSGNITITAMPLKGGIVKGTFTGSGLTETNEKFSVSGDFSLTRM